jgi:RNA recognition motif-containing protein
MTTRLYISNLAVITLKQDLDILFGHFSKTVFAKLIKEKFTHMPNGFAFINMFNHKDACHAIKALNGTKLQGKTIGVVLANTRREPHFSIQYWS